MTTPDQVVLDVHREGAAIWPGFVDGARLVELRAAAERLATGEHALRFPKSTRVWDLYRHDHCFLDLLTEERFRDTGDRLLGVHHLLSDFSLNVVHPHQLVDDWHIDYPFNEMSLLVSGSLLGLQCVLALDDFGAANGATQYVPGSHDRPRRPDAAVITSTAGFHAPAGTLLVMAAATWHRSGVNISARPRSAILLSFVERWVRPMTDPPEPGPWAATEQLRLLLGMERPPETINGVPVTGVAQETP